MRDMDGESKSYMGIFDMNWNLITSPKKERQWESKKRCGKHAKRKNENHIQKKL